MIHIEYSGGEKHSNPQSGDLTLIFYKVQTLPLLSTSLSVCNKQYTIPKCMCLLTHRLTSHYPELHGCPDDKHNRC